MFMIGLLRSFTSAALLEEEFDVMAWPWEFEENFETGTLGSFTLEKDDGGSLDFPGPQDGPGIAPALGGYVMRVNMERWVSGFNGNAYVENSTQLLTATGQTHYVRLMFCVSHDTVLPSSSDLVKFLQICTGATDSAAVEEVSLALIRSTVQGELALTIFTPDTGAVSVGSIPIDRGMWTPVEIAVTNHASTGRMVVTANGTEISADRITNTGTFTRWRIGSISRTQDVRGTLYFDHVVIDNEGRLAASRLINPSALDGEDILITKTGGSYVFVGPGTVRGITLIGGTAAGGDQIQLFDTDSLPFSHHDMRAAAKASTAETVFSPPNREYSFSRGCYAYLLTAGVVQATALASVAQAIVHIGVVQEMNWMGGGFDEE